MDSLSRHLTGIWAKSSLALVARDFSPSGGFGLTCKLCGPNISTMLVSLENLKLPIALNCECVCVCVWPLFVCSGFSFHGPSGCCLSSALGMDVVLSALT